MKRSYYHENFPVNVNFLCIPTVKAFHLECFAIYGIQYVCNSKFEMYQQWDQPISITWQVCDENERNKERKNDVHFKYF